MEAIEFLNKIDCLSKRGSPEEKMRYNAYRVAGDNTGHWSMSNSGSPSTPSKPDRVCFWNSIQMLILVMTDCQMSHHVSYVLG